MRLWLKELRDKKGLTQSELAQNIGVSEQYIYYIESGKRRPSVANAKKIAEILGFEWVKFFEEDKE